MKKQTFPIQYGVFTTNEANYSPIDFFTIFINNTKSQRVEKKGLKRIDFLFEFSQKNFRCASSILFIKDFDEDYPVCNMVDSFVILIDLEQEDALKTLEDIVAYLTTYGSMEKQMYLLGLSKAGSLKHNEEDITKLCDENKLLYDYKEANAGDYSDVVNSLEEVYLDSLETLKEHHRHSTVEISLDKSGKDKSCRIF